MKRSFFLCLFFLLCITLKAQKIIFSPQWTAQSQFAGYYVADKKGFFEEEGLDVAIDYSSLGDNPYNLLKEKKSDIITLNLSQALSIRANEGDLVNIMQTSQRNSLMLIGQFPLPDISALQHKKIAVWNHLNQELLDLISKRYNLDVEWVRFNGSVNLFLSGAIDISMVCSFNEYIQLTECGLIIDSTRIMRLSDWGYKIPEEGVYVTEEYYNNNKDIIQKFIRASVRGWEYAEKNRAETIAIVMEEIKKNNIGTNQYHQHMMLDEIINLQYNDNHKKTFRLSEEDFNIAIKTVFPDDGANVHFNYQDFVK